MLRKWLCQADVTVFLEPIDPILIKSGYATLDGPDMVPVSTLRNGEKTYYFPGSSLKGVLRSHFERIARSLKPGSVCLPYYDPKRKKDLTIPASEEAESYGCGYRKPGNGREKNAVTAYHESCAACRLFGSLRFSGRFSIGDAYPIEGHKPTSGPRNGVGIDRFTGGTVRGVLFDLLVLEGGIFETRIRVVNFELWQLATLNFLLQDIQDEMITVGSGRSRGLGRVKGTVREYRISYVKPQASVVGLSELATAEEKVEYRLHDWQCPPIALESARRRGLRYEHDLLADWSNRLEPLSGSLEAFLEWHNCPLGTVEVD